MKALIFEYNKPHHVYREQYPDAVWQFSTRTDEVMPHGHSAFGGLLKRAGANGGLWQARHFGATDWAPMGYTREHAIQNLIPFAIEAIQAWKLKEEQHNEALQARRQAGEDMRKLAQAALPDFKIAVSVNLWDVNTNRVSTDPLRFHIHVDDLNTSQALRLIRILGDGMDQQNSNPQVTGG